MRAAHVLGDRGVHVTTLKSFRDEELPHSAAKSRYSVITMKNHTVIGGLGTAVSEMTAASGTAAAVHRIGLEDTYAHGASQGYLMAEYGLDALHLVRKVESVIGESLDISRDDLSNVRLSGFAAEGQLEAL